MVSVVLFPVDTSIPAQAASGVPVVGVLSGRHVSTQKRRVLIPRVVSFRVDGVAFAASREDEAHARWIESDR